MPRIFSVANGSNWAERSPPPEKGEYEGVGIQGGEKDGHKKISEQERLETTKEKQEKRKLRVSKTGWSIKV